MDIIWENFGLLEFLLSIEIVVLISAAFFYQVAKLIARTDRQDPLVRFYRVFWKQFFSGVTPIRDMDLAIAASYAREAGYVAPGELGDDQLSQLDAPDFGDFESADASAKTSAPTTAKPIGRTGPENEDRIRPVRDTESRESKFLKAQKESSTPAAPPARTRTAENVDTHQTATSTIDIRVIPMSPKDEIAGMQQGELVVRLIYAPEDGRANGAIIELFAKMIDVRPYQVSLLRGHYKLRKTLQVAGVDQTSLEARLL